MFEALGVTERQAGLHQGRTQVTVLEHTRPPPAHDPDTAAPAVMERVVATTRLHSEVATSCRE